MSREHWQSFQRQQQQSFRYAESSMPIYADELERQRRKQDGLCSLKSLFCCLSVLVGRRPAGGKEVSRNNRRRQAHQYQMEVLRSHENDDDSFGYNFDEQLSPIVLTRLTSRVDHNIDWIRVCLVVHMILWKGNWKRLRVWVENVPKWYKNHSCECQGWSSWMYVYPCIKSECMNRATSSRIK